MLLSLLWACTTAPSSSSSAEPSQPACVSPALVTHLDGSLAVHRVAAVEGGTAPPDVVTDGWVAPGAGEAVVNQVLASRLGISVGDTIKTTHQLPNGAADIHTYTTTALASVQPGFELTVFVVQPSDSPCQPYVLTPLQSSRCPVLLNSPSGAALAAVMPLPAGVSLASGQVGLSSDVVQALELKAEGAVLLTAPPVRNELFEVVMLDELAASGPSSLHLSEDREHSLCGPAPAR